MSNDETKEQENKPVLRFNYFKSKDFRVIKVDGAHGGLTPRGDIVMSVFNERLPIPDSDEFEISEEGGIGKQIKSDSKTKGIVREVETTLALRPDVALSLGKWLLDKVSQFEKAFDIKLEEDDESDKEIIEKSKNETEENNENE